MLYDEAGDIQFVEIEESKEENGAIIVKFDGLEEETVIIARDGYIL